MKLKAGMKVVNTRGETGVVSVNPISDRHYPFQITIIKEGEEYQYTVTKNGMYYTDETDWEDVRPMTKLEEVMK